MAYVNNRFCWHGVISTDVAKATAFYSEAIGWKVQKAEMGGDEVTMFAGNDGVPRAHIMAPPMDGVPSHWNNYLRVDDVDARTKAAEANGGKVLVPPNDIPPGRFAVVTTPSGAAFSLFHEADEATANNPELNGHGAVHWVELHSKDIDADIAWLGSTLGLTTDTMPLPDGGTYYLLKDGETSTGGAMQAMSEEAPAHWLAWIAVDDADAAAGRVSNHGGQVLSPLMDMEGVGRMCVAQDNTGGVFGIIQPANKG